MTGLAEWEKALREETEAECALVLELERSSRERIRLENEARAARRRTAEARDAVLDWAPPQPAAGGLVVDEGTGQVTRLGGGA